MFAQYSALFTSGLLESSSPSASRPSEFKLRPRKKSAGRDSLPVNVNTASTSFYGGACTPHDASDDSAIFLTFVPRRMHADIDADRSFLSLDLAESQSMRSMSLRRKDTVTTRATISFGTYEPDTPFSSSHQTLLTLSDFPPPPSTLAGPPRRNASRDANRLPRAKPIPSSSLPELPQTIVHTRRPSNLRLTLSTWCTDVSSSAAPLSMHHSSHSAPSILSSALTSSPIYSPSAQSYFSISPIASTAPIVLSALVHPPSPSSARTAEPPVSPTAAAPRPAVNLKVSASMRSTASHHTRQVNRSAALAALEGRPDSASPRRGTVRPRNFMSMSDDEDEPEEDGRLMEVLREQEDVVVPAPVPVVASPCFTEARRSRARASSYVHPRSSCRGTIESFLGPLANFIDFKDDDGSARSWRSFVEISS